MPKVAKEIVMADANKRSAAVTGAGGGLGRDIALGLAAKNYRVFGTAMTPGEIADIKQASCFHGQFTDASLQPAVKRSVVTAHRVLKPPCVRKALLVS